MTLSGNSTENLWLLSMMRLAGWDSVTVEFNSNCLRFWRKVHIFIWTLMLLNQCKAMRRRHNHRYVFSEPIAHGRRLQEELSGSAYTINMGKKKINWSFGLKCNEVLYSLDNVAHFIVCPLSSGGAKAMERTQDAQSCHWLAYPICSVSSIILMASVCCLHWSESFFLKHQYKEMLFLDLQQTVTPTKPPPQSSDQHRVLVLSSVLCSRLNKLLRERTNTIIQAKTLESSGRTTKIRNVWKRALWKTLLEWLKCQQQTREMSHKQLEKYCWERKQSFSLIKPEQIKK